MKSGVGLPLAILSAATFGTSGSFATALLDAGWSPGAAVLARVTLAAMVLTVPAILSLRGRWHVLRTGWTSIAPFGLVAVAGCQLFYFNALQHLSVSIALLMEYLGIVFVVGWMWLRHAKRPTSLTVAGSVVAVTGLVLVLNVFGAGARVNLVGLLWGLAAAVGVATYFVVSSRDDRDVPPIAVAWGGMVLGAIALAIFGALRVIPMHENGADVRFAGHQTSWITPVLGLAVIAAAIPYLAGIAATRRLGATVASFVGLTEVLFGTLFAWLLLSQRPTPVQAVGGLVVLGGIVLVRAGELRSATKAPEIVNQPVAVTAAS